MKESDILHEAGQFWVAKNTAGGFVVYKLGITHSTSDSVYADKSLAIARCNYLDKSACNA